MTPERLQELPPRFVDKVEVLPEGCWRWTGATNGGGIGFDGGYPYYWHEGRSVRAHRFAFEALESRDLAASHDLHHTCGRRCCVRPGHLEPLPRHRHNELTHGGTA